MSTATRLTSSAWLRTSMRNLRSRIAVWQKESTLQPELMQSLEGRQLLSSFTLGTDTGTPVNNFTTNTQSGGVIAMASNGSYVVAWAGNGTGDSSGIYARRFNADGTANGNQFSVNNYTTNTQSSPSISIANDGSFVIAWSGQGSASETSGIWARQFNADGTAVANQFQVNNYTTGTQTDAQIAVDPTNGDFIIAWSGEGSGDNNGIFARRFLSNGTADGNQFIVNTVTTNNQTGPAIAVNNSGAMLITWQQEKNASGSDAGILAQRFDTSGVAVGSNIQVVSLKNSADSAAGVFSDGSFVVAYADTGNDRIFGQRIGSDGTLTGSSFQINTYTSNNQSNPSIAIGADNRFVVAWESNTQDGSNLGVYTAAYNSDATAIGSILRVNTYTTNDQATPSVAGVNGSFRIIWSGQGAGDSDSIYQRPATITLNPVVSSPIADQVINENGSITIDLSAHFSGDFSSLTFSATSNTNPTLITTKIVGSTLTLTFAENKSGTGDITITATDGASQTVADTFSVTVNDGRIIWFTPYTTPRGTALTSTIFATNAAIDLATLTNADITLTRNGNPVSTTGITFAVAPAGYNQAWYEANVEPSLPGTDYTASFYQINIPAGLTSDGGVYVLTVNGSGVTTLDNGKAINTNVGTTWTTEARLSGTTQFSAPRTTPVNQIFVQSNFGIDLATFAHTDLTLTLNGNPVDTTGATLTAAGGSYPANSYFINLPSALTAAPGSYALTLTGSGIATNGGAAYSNNASTSWTTQAKLTSISSFPGTRTTPVTTVVVTSSTGLDLSTFTAADLSLTLNGNPVDTTGITVTAHGSLANTYLINIPAATTTPRGVYALAVDAAGIQASNGAAVTNNLNTNWNNVALITAITQFSAPRSTPMTSVNIGFNTDIDLATFTAADITLTLNGDPVDTTGITVTAHPSATNYYVINIPSATTAAAGNYLLSVNGSGITTPLGTVVNNNTSTGWTTQARLSGITQYTGTRSTSLTSTIFWANQPLDLSTFSTADITLTLNGDPADTTGITIEAASGYPANYYRILIPAGLTSANGTYVLTVVGAGLSTPSGIAFSNDVLTTWTKA